MKLLLTTDGSEDSRAAVRFLKRLTLPPETEATILTVVDTRVAAPARARAEQAAAREVAELQATGWTLSSVLRIGQAADEITACAKEIDADLVVAGSRGHGAVKRFLLGSTSDQVARHAPCSVLIVRHNATEEPVDLESKELRIVLAHDGSETASAAVDLLATLSKNDDAHVKLITVLEIISMYGMEYIETTSAAWQREKQAAAETLEAASKRLSAVTGKVTIDLIEATNASEAIIESASRFGADLVVIGEKGASAVDRFMLGSVTGRILHHSPSSVLIVRQKS